MRGQFVAVLAVVVLAGCSSMGSVDAGLVDGKLRLCPDAPHCVSSDATDSGHQIAALAINGDASVAWSALKAHLTKAPHVVIVEEKDGYLHATATSAMMGFVDDFEFVLRADKNEMGMRSSSRIGYYDFNVNRTRLEGVRSALQAKGVLK